MRVLVVSPGQDTGGMGIRIKRAFEKHPGRYEARAVRSTENYIAYPADVETYRVPRSVVQKLYDEADVIHCSNSFDALRRYGRGRPKPVMITHQGTAFRTTPEPFIKESRRWRAVQTVSTIDLLTLFDDPSEGQWSPHPVDTDEMVAARQASEPHDGIIVHHSPTNRRVKSTAVFMEAMGRLMHENRRVKMQLVEGRTWKENIRLKARADIVYDQLILGWGTNALEAWAMGIPVIAATEFGAVREKMVEILGPELPPYEATADTLYAALKRLVNEPELREAYGQRGLRYVQRFHDEEAATDRLSGLYDEARGLQEAAA